MKLWHLSIVMMALSGACTVATDKEPAPLGEKEATGNLALALIGTDSQGNQYRLRNGTFTITGYPQYYEQSSVGGEGGSSSSYYYETVSTEDNLSSPVITRRVIPGYYYVDFTSSDWYFEKITPSGYELVENSVLLSGRSVSTRVYDGSTANVAFQFGVDGTAIDFRSGDINIGIRIERPGDGDGGEPSWGGAGGAVW